MCAALLVAPNASAQFFKQLGKAIEKVDKALDDLSGTPKSQSSQSQSSQSQSSQSQTSVGGADNLSAFYHSTTPVKVDNEGVPIANGEAMPVFVTSATKKIQLGAEVYGVEEFSDGVAKVRLAGSKSVFINTQGNQLFSFKSNPELKFHDGLALAFYTQDGKKVYGMLNKEGKYIRTFPYVTEVTDFVEGIAALKYVFTNQPNRLTCIVYIDTKGDRALDSAYFVGNEQKTLREMRPFRENLSAYYDYEKDKWGYMDRHGKVVIAPRFIQALDFSEGLAGVSVDVDGAEKWGYINTSGEFAIQPIFSYAVGSFSSGLAPVRKFNRNYCYIDKSGNIKSDEFRQISEFHNGYAFVRRGAFGQHIYDSNLRPVSYIGTTWAFPVSDEPGGKDNIIWESNVMYSEHEVFTYKGDLMFENLYGKFRNALAPWSGKDKDGVTRTGYINPKGELVLEFIDPQF